MRLTENPVFTRLTRNAGWPSARACLWLSFVLGITALAAMVTVTLTAHSASAVAVLTGLGIGAALLTILAPLIVAFIAGVVTSRDVIGPEYQLMRVTTLDARAIVSGYIGAALFRARLILGLVVALLPVLSISFVNVAAEAYARLLANTMCPLTGPTEYLMRCGRAFSPSAVVADTLVITGLAVATWGLSPAAAAVGAALGLRLRNTVLSALGGSFSVVIGLCILPPAALATLQTLSRPMGAPYPVPGAVGLSVVIYLPILVFYALAWLMARRAERWV